MSTIKDKLALANENVPKTYMAGKSCKYMTDFSYYFFNGARLDMLDCINTCCGTNFKSMFQTNKEITTIPKLDTSKGKNFCNMFYYCTNLTTIPKIDTSNGTTFEQMFYGCNNLSNIPKLDTSNGYIFKYMFASCAALNEIPQFNLIKGTDFSGMFSHCKNLSTVPPLNTYYGTSLANMFDSCTNLQIISSIVNNSVTDTNTYKSIVFGCTNLESIKFTHYIKYDISLKSCSKLTAECLQSIVDKLYKYTSAQYTITLSSTSWDVLESTTPPDGYSTWKEYITNYKYWKYA